ncbi:Mitochondrial fission protein [Coemansia erecta]|uniref:Mitochondrial fission protein n=1 Tax=Coemansia erecta TaxID=147472 RepID=A0A9W7XU89_9FUNG|nr:Mitochondrial fission protein [Coemansia erecta]
MRRKAVAADSTGDSDTAADDPAYEDSSGFLVRLVSRILFSNGSDLLSRLLRTTTRRLPTPPTALLASPPLTTQPSLLSGFALSLHPPSATAKADRLEIEENESNSDKGEEEEEEGGLAISAREFDVLLARVPGDMRRTCLLERRAEYGEMLRRLEHARGRAVARLERVDARIMRLVEERIEVDRRLERLGSEDQGEIREEQEEEERETEGREEEAGIEDTDGSADAGWTEEADEQPRLRLERALVGHYGAVTALASDAALGLVASGSVDTHVRVWDTTTTASSSSSACLYTIAGHTDAVRAVQFYERFLLTASSDSRVRMWDLSLLDSVQPQASDLRMQPQYLPGSPLRQEEEEGREPGRWVMTEQSTTPPVTPTICRGLLPLELCCETAFVGHGDAVTCMQTAEGGTLVTGSADRTVREWDLATGAVRQTIDLTWATRSAARSTVRVDLAPQRGTERGDGGFVGALQVYGHALATGTSDGALRLWDLRTAQPHRQMFGHQGPVTSLRFDEHSVVTGGMDGRLVVWDLRMGAVRQSVGFEGPVTCVQMGSTPGECWVAASDPAVHRYWAKSMQQVAYAAGGAADVTRVHVRDTGIVTGDADGAVRVWRI